MKPNLIFSFFFLLVLFTSPVFGQTVSNVHAEFTDCHVEVMYDLSTDNPVDLTLEYRVDDGEWLPCITVSGDTANQSSGSNKLIIWDNYTDNARWGLFEFRVKPPPSKPVIDGCTVKSSLTAPPHNGWITFMCYNLGANENMSIEEQMTYNPISNTDPTVYGDLYQWGRVADGHEKRTSSTTSTLATSNTPGHSNFINGSSDWRSGGGEISRWGDGTQDATVLKAGNDPCPEGWRMPTEKEWASIYGVASGNTWVWNSTGTPGYKISPDDGATFPLFLPAAGERVNSDGMLGYVGTFGYYWSSSVYSTYSYRLYFGSDYVYSNNHRRANGFSCLCVAE